MSVGHIARRLEEEGIQTLIIASFSYEEVLKSMKVPRLLCTPFPMGRPMGKVGDFSMQVKVLKEGLALFSQKAPVMKILDEKTFHWV